MGGSGGGSYSRSTSDPVNMTPYSEIALGANFLTPYLANAIQQTQSWGNTGAAPQYQGNLFAPMTPQEAATVGGGTNFYNSIAAGNSINNPMLESYIRAAVLPIQQQYTQEQASNLGAFTQAGQDVQNSSPFDYAQALAQRGTAQAIGQTAAGIAYPAYQLAAQQQYQAPLNAFQLASVPQQIAESGVQAGLSNYQQQLNYISSLNQLAGNVGRTTLGQRSGSTSIGLNAGVTV